MKKATVYIIILGVLCTGVGVVSGMVIERKRLAKNFPHILRGQLLKHPQAAEHVRQRLQYKHQERVKDGTAKIFERIGEELNLTDQQKEQVKVILESTKQQIEVARDGFKEGMEKAKETSQAQILTVLDPEQQEKFKEITAKAEQRKAQIREKMKERRDWSK
jgi:uncharacterized protein YneF (UPF0154 family)